MAILSNDISVNFTYRFYIMKLFKYKHEKIINNFQRKAFAAWEIPIDDIASEFRFKAVLAVYVSIFLSGSIEDKTTVEKISQSIFMKIRETVVNKRCRVSDVFKFKYVFYHCKPESICKC